MSNEVCGIIPFNEIEFFFETSKTQKVDQLMQVANYFFANGYDMRQFLIQLNDYVINRPDLNDNLKWEKCELIMKKEIALLKNSSPNLLLYSLMSEIMKMFTLS